MALIQICRSICKSASVYVAAEAGLGVDLGVGVGFEKSGASPGKPGIAVSGALAGPFSFAVASL